MMHYPRRIARLGINTIEAQVPAEKAVHVILDNYAVHKHPNVRGWLGADVVLDYASYDYSSGGAIYDVVFDTVGKSKIGRGVRALKRGGAYVFAATSLASYVLVSLYASLTGRIRVNGGIARGRSAELSFLMQLIRDGKFRPVIDRTYPLSEIVAAHAYAQAGHKKGNLVVLVD